MTPSPSWRIAAWRLRSARRAVAAPATASRPRAASAARAVAPASAHASRSRRPSRLRRQRRGRHRLGAGRGDPAQLARDVPRRLPALVRVLRQAALRRPAPAPAASAAAAPRSAAAPSLRIAAIRLAWLVPSNARFPVAISYSTQPSAQRSRARVGLLPLQLLRRHVLERPDDRPLGRQRTAHRRRFGQRAGRRRQPRWRGRGRSPSASPRPSSA